MGIAFGGAEICVTEEGLDIANVGTAFQKMSGEGMTETVDRGFFIDLGLMDSVVKNVLGGSYRKMACRWLSGE